MMNPVFSIAHMRRMIPVFNTVVHRLQEAITMRVAGAGPAGAELDMLMWMGRTALELVGQAGLGYSFDPLVSDSEDEFGAAVKAIQCVFCVFVSRSQPALISTAPSHCSTLGRPALSRVNYLRRLVPYLPTRGKALQRWILERIPNRDIQRVKELVDIMHRCSVKIFEGKKAALAAGDESVTRQVGEGKDIMSILSEFDCGRYVKLRLTLYGRT